MSTTRRFFFDDGRSRKRWQIETSGKSVTIRYGRLTGQLRDTKKMAKSPAEAQKMTDQVIAEKVREGYTEIDAKRLEVVRAKGARPATEKQIKTLEQQLGVELPSEYRTFLLTCNGGIPNPSCVRVPGMSDIANVSVGTLYRLQPNKPAMDEITYEIEHTQELLPKGHLPIAGDSDVYTLSLHPKSFGAVYWWFHETEDLDDESNFLESAGYPLAGSFDEFLTRIADLYTEDAIEEPRESIKSSSKASLTQLIRTIQKDHTPQTVIEIKRIVGDLGDISGIEDGQWPFINIDSAQVLSCLLEAGLNPEILDSERQSLLWQCAASPECIALLGNRGVDLDRRSGSEGETALMRAIFLKQTDAIKQLVKMGANPTLRFNKYLANDLKRDAKLSRLIEKAKIDWKKKLSKAAKRPKPFAGAVKPTGSGKGPKPSINKLLQLMKHDWIQEGEVIEGAPEMIAALGDLSSIKAGQWPAIDKFEDPHLLQLLLDAGLDPNITDKKGNPLLYQCASHPECIELLRDSGAAIDQKNRENETALMRACYVGETDCVQCLLDSGADPTIEFSSFARVMIEMDEEMDEFIQAARQAWASKGRKRNKSKKA